jgi:hypothetical protein
MANENTIINAGKNGTSCSGEKRMKKPLVIVFCNATDHDFECCDSGSGIRVVGNVRPGFPDEELWIKHCQLHYRRLGECSHQVVLDRFPSTPAVFLGNSPDQEREIAKLDRIIDAKIQEHKDRTSRALENGLQTYTTDV